jgi:LytR cell envelope-related transcriptional attenuator
MDLIEKIGPFVGLVAFIGLAVLAFVIFQQSRDVRRLREWAGRAPERAKEAADASAAAAEARGEATGEAKQGRLAALSGRMTGAVGSRVQAVDRHLPIDGRIVLGVLAAGLVAAGVLTSGFGLLGEDGEAGKGGGKKEKQELPEVAVFNATQTDTGVQGVPGLADRVASEVLRPAGYPVGEKTNAPTGFAETIVMFKPKAEGDAAQLARAIERKLGETRTEEMAADIRAEAKGAPLALVIGADDAEF